MSTQKVVLKIFLLIYSIKICIIKTQNKVSFMKGVLKMFIYKKDILKELADRGYNCSRMRKEKILGEGTIQNIRKGKGFTLDTLNTICCILRCQPSDIIDIVPSDEEKIKYF